MPPFAPQLAKTVAQTPYQAPHGIPPGSIAGIVLGAFLGVVIIIVVLVVACTRTLKPVLTSKGSKKTNTASWLQSANELNTLPAASEQTAQEMADMRSKGSDIQTEESEAQPIDPKPRRKKKRLSP